MTSTNYTPTKQTLGAILNNTSPALRVPEYQRDFSWQSKHVLDYWNDLIDFVKKCGTTDAEAHQEYFLGTVVMVNNSRHHLVLDGQQRLATTTILLAVIRNRLRGCDEKTAEFIHSNYIVFENPLDPGQERLYKVELNTYDKDFFRRVVQDERTEVRMRPDRESHKRILSARRRLDECVDSLLKDKDEPSRIQILRRLVLAITKQFTVVAIMSTEEDQAASIFETLNERGVSLSTADLLRSWVLSKATRSTRDEIVRLWDQIGAGRMDQRVETLIRISWISAHGDVKTRALYKIIKDQLQTSKTGPIDYSRNLAADAAYLKELGRGKTNNDVVNQAALDLVSIKATSGFAALLAAHNNLRPEEEARLARAVVALALRHNVFCRHQTSQFESGVYACAKAISDSRDLEVGLTALRAISPGNDEVRGAWKRLSFKPQMSRAAQVVLRGIETGRHRSGETQIAPRQKVHLEHILAQNPRKGSRVRDHTKVVYLLGNLTLLAGKLNREASNAEYPKKKKVYLTSELGITKEIPVRYRQWGKACIVDRQQRLLEEAVRVWPQSLIS